uniref:C-type lectin domain-containing protein n=1 Tax=Oryzias latipes TaxID=8090 RepID=A0A3B3HFB0_ORYLA
METVSQNVEPEDPVCHVSVSNPPGKNELTDKTKLIFFMFVYCGLSDNFPPIASIKSNRRCYLGVITFMMMLSVLLLAGLVILGLLCEYLPHNRPNVTINLFFLLHSSQKWKTGCPEKWIRFGSSCYFFSEGSKSWDKAREFCRARGADLVVINTKEENQQFWIGLSDRDLEGTWKWVDGSPLTLQFWGSDQPDNSGEEDCGHIRNGFPGVWNDISCLSSMQWICEKEQMLFV